MVLDINVIESLINFNGILVASITLNVVLKARHKCKNNLLNWMLSFFLLGNFPTKMKGRQN